MVKLDELPEELLLQILDEVSQRASYRTILRYALINRLFARLALPLVYRDLEFENTEDSEFQLRKLLRVLLFNSIKASYVHSFRWMPVDELFSDYDWSDDAEDPFRGLNQGEQDYIKRWIDELFGQDNEGQVELHVRWVTEWMDRKSTVYLFALLLPRLRNLRKFTMLADPDRVWQVLDESVAASSRQAAAKDQQLPLPALAIVCVAGEGLLDLRTSLPLAMVSKWPNVKQLSGTWIFDGNKDSDKTPHERFLVLESRSLKLKTLKLAPESKLLGVHLIKLMGTFKALESFRYAILHDETEIPFKSTELGEALLQQRHSLKTILLDVLTSDPGYQVDGSVWLPMDLTQFVCLEKLHIDFVLLFGVDPSRQHDAEIARIDLSKAIPTSVRDLAIVNCTSTEEAAAAFAALEKAIRNKRAEFPELRKITLGCVELEENPQAFVTSDQDKALHQLASEEGIESSTLVGRWPLKDWHHLRDAGLSTYPWDSRNITDEDWTEE